MTLYIAHADDFNLVVLDLTEIRLHTFLNGTIDSNGKYIGIDSDDEWSFVNIQCFIKNDDQKSQIMDMSSGDEVTIRGKITGVGEVLGYSIDIESIE